MSNSEQTRAVLVHALKLIKARGWTVRFSNGPASPLNLRSAVSSACGSICANDSEWYREYNATMLALRNHLKDGVTSWEFGTHANPVRRRRQAEVEAMLAEIINRLEKQ